MATTLVFGIVAASTGLWEKVKTIESTDDESLSGSCAVSGDGNYAAVVVGTNIATYRLANDEWSPFGSIPKDSSLDSSATFGYSMSFSHNGSRLAVGANSAAFSSGRAFVYARGTSDWTLEHAITPNGLGTLLDGVTSGGHFGYDVALSSDGASLLVSAPTARYYGMFCGTVQKYTLSASTWSAGNNVENWPKIAHRVHTEARERNARTHDTCDSFGHSVALSSDGTSFAIGVPLFEPSSQTNGQGTVILPGGSPDGTAANDQHGLDVAMSDDGLFVAAGSNAGYVRTYKKDGDAWTELVTYEDTSPGRNTRFGRNVAMSGNGLRLAIIAPAHGDLTGRVIVYARSTTDDVWTVEETLFEGTNIQGDDQPNYIQMSFDGRSLIVGDGDARTVRGYRDLHVFGTTNAPSTNAPSTNAPSTNSPSSDDKISGGALAGIILGSVAGAALVGFGVYRYRGRNTGASYVAITSSTQCLPCYGSS